MAKEYIEREAEKRAIMGQYLSRANKTKYADVIDTVPAVDVVPVVRCRDCEIHGHCATEDAFSLCGIRNPFCCAGKRKDCDGNG